MNPADGFTISPSVPTEEQASAWREMVADSKLAQAARQELFTETISVDDYPGSPATYAWLRSIDDQIRNIRDRDRANPEPARLAGETTPPRSHVPAFCRTPDGHPRGLDHLDDHPAVHRATIWVAEHQAGQPIRGLLLLGKPGRGKTAIAAAIAVDSGEPNQAAFWTTRDLLTAAKNDMLNDTTATLARAQTKPLLVLDDLGRERRTDYNIDTIRQLLEFRYDRGLPVVLTSNLIPDELAEHVGARLWSRLADMVDIVPVGGNDRRLAGAAP